MSFFRNNENREMNKSHIQVYACSNQNNFSCVYLKITYGDTHNNSIWSDDLVPVECI